MYVHMYVRMYVCVTQSAVFIPSLIWEKEKALLYETFKLEEILLGEVAGCGRDWACFFPVRSEAFTCSYSPYGGLSSGHLHNVFWLIFFSF